MKQLRCLEGDSETPSVTKKDSPENNRWIRNMNKKLKLEKLIGCLCFLNMFLMAVEFVKTEGNRRKFVSLSVKISHKVIILPSSHSNHPSVVASGGLLFSNKTMQNSFRSYQDAAAGKLVS